MCMSYLRAPRDIFPEDLNLSEDIVKLSGEVLELEKEESSPENAPEFLLLIPEYPLYPLSAVLNMELDVVLR